MKLNEDQLTLQKWVHDVAADARLSQRGRELGVSDVTSCRVIVWPGDARCHDGQHLDSDNWYSLEQHVEGSPLDVEYA
jgi:hypothetical protein